jgi:hypothetical protein
MEIKFFISNFYLSIHIIDVKDRMGMVYDEEGVKIIIINKYKNY